MSVCRVPADRVVPTVMSCNLAPPADGVHAARGRDSRLDLYVDVPQSRPSLLRILLIYAAAKGFRENGMELFAAFAGLVLS